jgi:hypothetical protein
MGYKTSNDYVSGTPRRARSRLARVSSALAFVTLVAGFALACLPGPVAAKGGPAQDPLTTPSALATASLPATVAVGAATLQVQVPARREVRAQCRAAGLVRQCAAAGVP